MLGRVVEAAAVGAGGSEVGDLFVMIEVAEMEAEERVVVEGIEDSCRGSEIVQSGADADGACDERTEDVVEGPAGLTMLLDSSVGEARGAPSFVIVADIVFAGSVISIVFVFAG